MKIATAAYPLDVLTSWAQYEDKLAGWVATAAASGAELLVFPEYGAMELATLAGLDVAGNLEASLFAVSDRLADADAASAAARTAARSRSRSRPGTSSLTNSKLGLLTLRDP